ncbi:hypothetical protein PR048_030639 [Dryococelus australis]|uniref:Uncharacterized protein n=1 Tax=Dryococelus australis TaxID=614101 RepID=A0ABQ9G9H4_9NEOP|nr:hypothetical protein PR048_030639 [Dryococelus australis]
MKRRVKWEIPKKTCRPAASSSTIPTCKNPGASPICLGERHPPWDCPLCHYRSAPGPPMSPACPQSPRAATPRPWGEEGVPAGERRMQGRSRWQAPVACSDCPFACTRKSAGSVTDARGACGGSVQGVLKGSCRTPLRSAWPRSVCSCWGRQRCQHGGARWWDQTAHDSPLHLPVLLQQMTTHTARLPPRRQTGFNPQLVHSGFLQVRIVPVVDGFSRGSTISPALSFWRYSILTSFRSRRLSRPQC